MMRRTSILILAGLAVLAVNSVPALAQQAPLPAESGLRVVPDAAAAAPHAAVRGFDTPVPTLTLQPASDPAALRGLAPGQDLTDGHVVLDREPLSAADADTYFATKDYQQKSTPPVLKGHLSAGQQFAGVGEAAAANLAISGVGVLLNGK
jgi:hypothetical protein